MKVTIEYLEERYAYWKKRIADAGIWDAAKFNPVVMEVGKRSKIYNGRFMQKWVEVNPTMRTLKDTIIIYQKCADISQSDIDNILVQMMILQYLQQKDLSGPLFIDLRHKINKAFPKELYIEGI